MFAPPPGCVLAEDILFYLYEPVLQYALSYTTASVTAPHKNANIIVVLTIKPRHAGYIVAALESKKTLMTSQPLALSHSDFHYDKMNGNSPNFNVVRRRYSHMYSRSFKILLNLSYDKTHPQSSS